MFQATISNQEASAMQVDGFRGKIVVVDDPLSMARAEKLLANEKILGIDTETRPAFTKGKSYSLALLQVSTPEVALLFRVQKVELSPTIISIMEDSSVLKIGAALRDDIKALQKVKRFTPAGFVDLQTMIYRWGVEEKSVRKMAAIVLGFKVSKAQRLSNWEAQRLTVAQQAYAATDAWVCLRIYQVLKNNAEITQKQ
ncbi:MAG: 3'-5' exonuclease [Mucinivorans sp.]